MTLHRANLVVLAALAGLGPACLESDWVADVAPIDLGTDLRLEAVTWDASGQRLYALGSEGLVTDGLGAQWDLAASVHDIIDVAGEADEGTGEVIHAPRLFVVGANGFVATAEHPGTAEFEFEVQAVGTQADLFAVTGAREPEFFAVIVGDDALIVAREDELGELLWTQPEAPPDGWGLLRDLGSPTKLLGESIGETVCAVGLAGRMVCASEDDLDTWEVEALDSDANLTRFCYGNGGFVVGEDGTVLAYDMGAWRIEQTDPRVDLVGCTTAFLGPVLIGGDRTIYRYLDGGTLDPLLTLSWQPRGLDPQLGVVLVGDDGHAGVLQVGEGLVPK